MLVDTERVLLDLKRHVALKSHHGQRELLSVIAQLEVANRIEESLPERAVRLLGLEFYEEAIRAPGSARESVREWDGQQVRALRGDSHHNESEEDNHAHRGISRDNGSVATVARIAERRRPPESSD